MKAAILPAAHVPASTPAGRNSAFLSACRLTKSGGRGRQHVVKGVGGDAVQGWIDIAKLVSGGGGFKSVYKDLAQKIGSDVYIDVNGWHLFLRDVTAGEDLKLNQALAQQIGENAGSGDFELEALLKKIPVKIGGGKAKVSLYEAIPSFSLDDLSNIVQEFQRE